MAGGLTLCHAMKSITPNLAVGGEGFYHLHKPLKGASLAARAVWGPKEEHVATVKAGSFGQAELSYQRKVSDKVGLATELMYYHNQLCTFGLGYEFRLRQAALVRVRGSVRVRLTLFLALTKGVILTLTPTPTPKPNPCP